eukprot:Gb_37664 [translate_table: standard]
MVENQHPSLYKSFPGQIKALLGGLNWDELILMKDVLVQIMRSYKFQEENKHSTVAVAYKSFIKGDTSRIMAQLFLELRKFTFEAQKKFNKWKAATMAFGLIQSIRQWNTLWMSAFRAFLNSPVGPKTTHFWGPVANWGFVVAFACIPAVKESLWQALGLLFSARMIEDDADGDAIIIGFEDDAIPIITDDGPRVKLLMMSLM